MRGIFVLLIVLFSASVYAQKSTQAYIDSSVSVLQHSADDTNKVNLLSSVSFACYGINPASGLTYGNQALALAEKLNWKKGVANANRCLGVNQLGLSNLPSALDHFQRSLKIYEDENDENNIARISGNIGMVYAQTNSDQALQYYNKALKLYEQGKDLNGIARISGNIGNIYYAQKKYDLALNAYFKALKLYDTLNDKNGIARNIQNIGLAYSDQGKYSLALKYNQRALEMNIVSGDSGSIATSMGNIGGIYRLIAANIQSTENELHITAPEALKKAITYLKKSIEIEQKIGALDPLQTFYGYLSDAQKLSGNYKEALESYSKHILYKDSVFSQQNAQKIASLETKHELENKDKLIQINKLEVAKKRNENIFFAIGIALLFLVIVFIVRERKKSEKLLLNILPEKIAIRLKNKEHPIADLFSGVSILFIDMVGFTEFSQKRNPNETVSLLNDVFSQFDILAEKYGLEKIKTIGDCYMAVAGIPEQRTDHATSAANMALAVKRLMNNFKSIDGTEISFRMGLDCGQVVAGVIGQKKFTYDLWGDAVNTASRMESSGIAGEIQCTDNFKDATNAYYSFTHRAPMTIKGKGSMQTWILQGPIQKV